MKTKIHQVRHKNLKQADKHTFGQTNLQSNHQTSEALDIKTDLQTVKQIELWSDRHPDTQRYIKTANKTDIQIYIQTSRDQEKQTENDPDIKFFWHTDNQTCREADIETSRNPQRHPIRHHYIQKSKKDMTSRHPNSKTHLVIQTHSDIQTDINTSRKYIQENTFRHISRHTYIYKEIKTDRHPDRQTSR